LRQTARFFWGLLPGREILVFVCGSASLMLRSDKSRGYCSDMVCEDFLTGADLVGGNLGTLLTSASVRLIAPREGLGVVTFHLFSQPVPTELIDNTVASCLQSPMELPVID
jgi:hypothetical protein